MKDASLIGALVTLAGLIIISSAAYFLLYLFFSVIFQGVF